MPPSPFLCSGFLAQPGAPDWLPVASTPDWLPVASTQWLC